MEEEFKWIPKEIKPPKTYKEQVEILRGRNLIIENDQRAIEVLQKINYYRLSAYYLSLKDKDSNQFNKGVTFDQIYRIYQFDMKLRNLLMQQLESIEISFRTHIAYTLAHNYGALSHEQSEYFVNEAYHKSFLEELNRSLDRHNELFITHHREIYNGKFPVWVAIEVTSFGMLSKLFANMRIEDKKKISKDYYGLPYSFVENWLMILSYVRNICAHFARIYNKSLAKKPRLDKKDKKRLGNDKIYSAIFVMKKLSFSKEEWITFTINLEALIDQFQDIIDLDLIGFPANWSDLLK